MKNPWLHRFAIVLAFGALLLIVDGAVVGPGTQLGLAVASAHRPAGIALIVLTFGLVLWLIRDNSRPESRRLGWVTLAIAVLEGLTGLPYVQSVVPRTAGVLHACLAPLLFAAVVAISAVTSPAWSRGPELVFDYGWPSMRSLAITTPVLVLLQISLGAAFRQKVVTLLPHVLGAMFVALVILFEAICVLQQFPAHRALPAAAKTLLGVAFGQVFLGITTLTMKSMADDTVPLVVATVSAHVTGGALTLATTVVLSILIRRNVQPRIEEDLEAPAAT
ncbi:MAG: putative Cytochrome oxidase assembly precursor [Bryobacterales bacterium]|nr:putative Cytochrome oxidase assembly precursor [Bryobacterales bacterium]